MAIAIWVFVVMLTSLANSLVIAEHCIRYGFDVDLPGASCAEIYHKNLASHGRSGYYILKTDDVFFAYCDMELECDGTKGGLLT